VKAPGHSVGLFIELAARVEPGHHEFKGADPLSRVNVNRNAPAVILHAYCIVPFQNHEYIIAMALHGLVNRIINHFKDKMMQSVYARGSNVHTRALSYRFQTFKNSNVLRRIVGSHFYILFKKQKKVNNGTKFLHNLLAQTKGDTLK
jgi:hypothetical protein